MKMPVSKLVSVATMAAVVGVAAFANTGFAQNNRVPPNAQSNNPVGELTPADTLFTVQFAGGTVEQYLEALRAANHKVPLNVSCAPDVMKTIIGPVRLESVTLYTALNAIGAANNDTAMEFAVIPLDSGQFQSPETGAMRAFRIVMKRSGPFNSGDMVRVQTFLIRDYIGGSEGDEAVKRATPLISAVEAAMKMGTSPKESWSVKFHPDAALLIIRGTSDDLSVAQQVIGQMVSDSRDKDIMADRRKAMEDERRRNVEIAQHMVQEAENERTRATTMMRDIEKKVQAGEAPQIEMEMAKQKYAEAEENFRFRKEQYRHVEEQKLYGQAASAMGAADASQARVRDLEATIESLKNQVAQLQAQLQALQTKGTRNQK